MTVTWSVLLVEAASDVELFVMAFATQVKAHFVRTVCAGVATPLDWKQPTCITANPAGQLLFTLAKLPSSVEVCLIQHTVVFQVGQALLEVKGQEYTSLYKSNDVREDMKRILQYCQRHRQLKFKEIEANVEQGASELKS